MAKDIRAIFKIVRGLEADLPILRIGELGYATDSNSLFIGDPDEGNVKINFDNNDREILNTVFDEIDKKINAEPGKGLSTNDLTNELLEKLLDSASENFVINKIAEAQLDVEGGDVDLSGLASKDDLDGKVDKVEGYSLISDTELTRLSSLSNYDDTDIKNDIDKKADINHQHDQYLTSIPSQYVTNTQLTAKGYATTSSVNATLSIYAKSSDVPTKISQLTDDVGYLTSIPAEYVIDSELNIVLAPYALIADIPTKVSQLDNDNGYLTSIPEEYITETELTNKGYATTAEVDQKIADAAINGAVDLTDYALKTEVPTSTSQLTNDSNYLTAIPYEYVTETELEAELNNKVDKEAGKGLSTNDLTNEMVVKIENAATQAYVTNAIAEAQLDGSDVDLTGLATKDELNEKAPLTHSHNISDVSDLQTALDSKVDAVSGKSLVSDTEIVRLASVDNYDDTEIRGLIPTKVSQLLNDRNYLNSVPSEYVTETELNNKIDDIKSEIDNNINEINTQLDTIEPEISKINTKVGRTEKGWADLNVFDEATRELILELSEGEINAVLGNLNVKSSNIGYEEVTADKLNFGRLGKNKFTGTFLYNTTLTGDGADGTFTVNNSTGGVCAIVRVTEGIIYTISVEEGHDRFRIGECTEYPTYGVKITKRHYADADNKVTLKAREGMNYFIIYLSSPNQGLIPAELQVEEGTKQTAYAKQTLILDYEDNTVPNSAIIKDRYQIGYQLGIGFNILTNDRTISVSQDINIIVGEKRRYNLNRGIYSYANLGAKIACVLANSSTKEIEFCKTSELINKGSEYDYLGIINTESNQIFINGNYSLNGKYIKPYTDESTPTSTNYNKNIISKEVSTNFINTSSYITPNTTAGGNALNDLYALWDDLVNKSDGYIIKSLLGNDTTGLPIYRYDFKPFPPQNNTMSITFPKVIFLGGIHGHERYCNFEDYRFFKELVENWSENDALEYLRFNVHFIVVPVQCPWGYQNKSRTNSNGVDINRNHESEWSLTSTGVDYSGSSAMSEIETQLIDDLLSKNKDAVFAIDHHNFNSFAQDGHIAWFGSRAEKTHKTIFGLCNYMDGYSKKKFPWLLTDNVANKSKNLYCLKSSVGGGLASTMWLKHGIQGIIYETVPSWSFSTDSQKYSGTNEDLQNLMTDLLGNLLLTVVKNNDYLIN